MKEQCKTFEELIIQAGNFLRSKLSHAENTVKLHLQAWRRIKRYMDSQQIDHFDLAFGKDYLLKKIGDKEFKTLSKREKQLVRFVNVLCEFDETGHIQPVKKQIVFEGSIGLLMTEYLSYKMTLRLKENTIDCHRQCLYRFLSYLNKNGITSSKAINHLHILNYVKGMDVRRVGLTRMIIQNLRGFLQYLYEQNYTDVDTSVVIPKYNRRKVPQLPSTYSPTEIDKLIVSINRATAHGKRDYAIVLIAARLGLRASDIANLKFENILWEQCTIELNQYKTERKIALPLLPEVGDAIIDYMKYGRPESNEACVFLLARNPYTRLYAHSLSGIVHSYFLKAGINIEKRKHGAHALRHSLASRLLEQETALPVISEVLGHEHTSSTEYYLRIDLKSMRQCALDVPSVSSLFYNQKGGIFYA